MEYDGVESEFISVILITNLFPIYIHVEPTDILIILKPEQILSREQQCEEDRDLVDGLSKDVAVHDCVHDVRAACVGGVLQQDLVRLLSRKGQGAASVHDQVHPEHLH